MVGFYKRNLPRWQPDGAAIFLTWRLHGSLPPPAIREMEARRARLRREAERSGETAQQRKVRHWKKLFAVIDEFLDKTAAGPMWLMQEEIAELVEDALLIRYRDLYRLWAYVVMANHVHALLQPKEVAQTSVGDQPVYAQLKEITKNLKGYTSREANKLLSRTGQPFWQQESFDHWARDEEEFYRIVAYIENNPVKAGLVQQPEEWTWSSAHERHRRGWAR